ncbi:NAD(P)H-binding protein [Angustibacter speluncae]
MLVITGATGALNGATVDHLLQRVAPDRVAVVVRDPARARHLADRGVTVRRGDYADPAGLPGAFADAEQLLLVSSGDPGADVVALHGAAVAAAAEAGVGRVLYTSHQGAAADSPFRPCRDHHATETLLAASGLPWTSLRNGFYAHSLDWLAGPWRTTGRITVPHDGPVSWTAREDLAQAAATLLASGRAPDGPVTLTAAAAPTFAGVAAEASDLTGREVVVETVDPQEWLRTRVAAGDPEPRARFVLGFYEAARDGGFAGTDPRLGELLGRAPRTARDALAATPG